MRLRAGYAATAAALLAIEIGIALFVDDAFVRPYFGDTLAVVLVHCALRAVTDMSASAAARTALLVAFAIELGQYFQLLDAVGLGESRVARIVLGGQFSRLDLVAYAAGAGLALAFEALWARRRRTP